MNTQARDRSTDQHRDRKEAAPDQHRDRKEAAPDQYRDRQGAAPAHNYTADLWTALEDVKDPEIPVISVVDMGMIADVRREGDAVVVDMTPTFAGCPALDVIRTDIRTAIQAAGHDEVTVRVVYDPPWTTERITERGRRLLKEFGLAPPGASCGGGTPKLDAVPCPLCDSTNTTLESIFGPTLCRSIHYCNACLQSFEHFKEV